MTAFLKCSKPWTIIIGIITIINHSHWVIHHNITIFQHWRGSQVVPAACLLTSQPWLPHPQTVAAHFPRQFPTGPVSTTWRNGWSLEVATDQLYDLKRLRWIAIAINTTGPVWCGFFISKVFKLQLLEVAATPSVTPTAVTCDVDIINQLLEPIISKSLDNVAYLHFMNIHNHHLHIEFMFSSNLTFQRVCILPPKWSPAKHRDSVLYG